MSMYESDECVLYSKEHESGLGLDRRSERRRKGEEMNEKENNVKFEDI